MSFKEKLDEYKQRKEARDYFNQNNSYSLETKDILLGVLIAIVVSCISFLVIDVITAMIGFDFTLFYFIAAYLVVYAIRQAVQGNSLLFRILIVIAFLFGYGLATPIYTCIMFHYFSIYYILIGVSTSLIYLFHDIFGLIVMVISCILIYKWLDQ